MADQLKVTTQGEFSCLQVHLQPRASRNEIVGVMEQSLKVRLTAPPVDDRANRQLIDFFAEILGVPRRDVVILHGQKSRAKTIGVRKMTPQDLTCHIHNILHN